jgi:hypothetical protein
MPQFRVRIDLGTDGVIDLKTDNISSALKEAYQQCKERKQNPVAVNVTQVVEQGKWEASVPGRSISS